MISLLLDTSNFKLVVAVVDEDKNEVLSYYNENRLQIIKYKTL